jgi:hypothetical protein
VVILSGSSISKFLGPVEGCICFFSVTMQLDGKEPQGITWPLEFAALDCLYMNSLLETYNDGQHNIQYKRKG